MKYLKLFIASFIVFLVFAAIANAQQILDKSNMDLSVKPGDDFFQYSNGVWMKNNPIPPDMTRYTSFDVLRENNAKQLKELVDECSKDPNLKKGTNRQKIGDFFASGMNEDKINSLGYEPIKKYLNDIKNLKSKTDAVKYIAFMHTMSSYPLFYFGPTTDDKNSAMTIGGFRQGGMTFGNKDYYLKDDERSKSIRAELLKLMVRLYKLIGYSDDAATAKSNAVMAFETRLAGSAFSNIELRDPDLNYNKMTFNEMLETAKGFDWKLYFKEIGLENPGDVDLGQKRFFVDLGPTFESISLEDLKSYLEWRVLNSSSTFLSKDFVDANFDFFGKFMSGQQEMRPRWKRVLDVVDGSLGEALGELYVEKHFPPNAKKRIQDLVANLRLALADRIRNLNWMSEPTKVKALEKLEKIFVKVGYPDKWEDYSKIEISKDSYFDNVMNVRRANYKKNIAEIGKPTDKTKWGMSPQTVNAYYNPANNEICFPAGILQPPYFYADGDDAVNYGGIGVVIGHEISHGFDDQGRKYDKDGNLSDWWTEQDANNFDKQAQVLIDQYNNYFVIDTFHVDGKFTLGENIGDLGGVNISLEALKKAWAKNPPEKELEGFTPIQRFFLNYATIWRGNTREQETLKRLKEDPHSPSEARVNCIVYNIPEFYEAFGVTSADKRFRSVNERAFIW
ncbi:MAG: M13 family metallopeptidase [Ignavibacteria bacterium]|nr:M13 family metallopeptidase [Ignavibacteria bacterium]